MVQVQPDNERYTIVLNPEAVAYARWDDDERLLVKLRDGHEFYFSGAAAEAAWAALAPPVATEGQPPR